MTDEEFMRDVLQRIATGPTLSKDLSYGDAARAMQIILDGKADEVQAGIFLIALRMKRETDDELAGILDAINSSLAPKPVNVDHLLTIVDPYDGYLRGTPAAPFLPPVLAACGERVVTHGMASVGPKFGATHECALTAAGYGLPGSTEDVAARLENDNIGWCYASQNILAPSLAKLLNLRTRIVKRPCLTTIEVAVNALRPLKGNHLVTGFVHKPYPPVYAALAKAGGFDSSLMVRGVEGGVVPSLTQAARFFCSEDGENLTQIDIEPTTLNIERSERATPLPDALQNNDVRSVKAPENPFASKLAAHAVTLGIAALSGEQGYARDSLVYSGAVILYARGKADSLVSGANLVKEALDSGSALKRFNSALA
ncbi:MAG: anthranilate phosphoribosyltransferase [Granulosicoccus sp.]